MVRKKSGSGPSDRSDPKRNKSLAIRNVLKTMPRATAGEICAAVKKEYGQHVSQNMVYMVKTKTNMAADGRKRVRNGRMIPISGPTQWVEAIKMARQLLAVTGTAANATALLKALEN